MKLGRPRMFTDEQAEAIATWYAKLCALPTRKAMAAELGCAPSTLFNYCKRLHDEIAFRNKCKDYGVDTVPRRGRT